MANYIDRLKAKLKIKKLDSDQPINAWLFVLILNFVGFVGYFYLKVNDIHLGDQFVILSLFYRPIKVFISIDIS